MLGAASNSMPPARNWDSISGSPPSWLLGKTVMFNRPDDCAPMARAASITRSVSGWVSGVLAPSLNSNSAAALAGLPHRVAADAADADLSRSRRVIFILASQARWSPLTANYRRTAVPRKAGAQRGAEAPRDLRPQPFQSRRGFGCQMK